MKIIEALKQIKDLKRKADDLGEKLSKFCCDLDCETPSYPDQKGQISGWLQAHRDICREMLRLKFCISKTNVLTKVTINIDNNDITRSISEWLWRRTELVELEKSAWIRLTNRGLKEGKIQHSAGTLTDVRIRYYYDIQQKDKALAVLSSETALIDAKLEIVNATTDLME